MFSFFKKKDGPTEMIAVVDIGSASAASALVELDRRGTPTVWQADRIVLPIEQMRDIETLKRRLASTVSQALTNTAEAALNHMTKGRHGRQDVQGGAIAHVAVFLPSPWSTLLLRNVRLARAAPVSVTPALIERMVADYVKRERPDKKTEAIIERSVVGLQLNGYSVIDIPQNTQAETIEMTVISATVDRDMLTALRDTIHKAIGHYTTISFHATSVAASYALSVIKPDTPDYILANAEGEVTELMLVTEHTPSAVTTATTGCATMERALVANGIPSAEVPSALTLAQNDASPMAQKIGSIKTTAGDACSAALAATASDLLKPPQSAPCTMYLLQDSEDAGWLKDALSRNTSFLALFPQGVEFTPLNTQLLLPHLTARGQGELDPYLALEAIYTDARFDQRRAFNFKLSGKK